MKKQAGKELAKQMNDMLFTQNVFVVVDIETTALSPNRGGMIIEIGAYKVENGEIKDRFHSFIDPGRKIYSQTTKLTGITNEMVEGQPAFHEVLPRFFQFINGAVVVAHNVGFDWDSFLLHFFSKCSIFPQNPVIDTVALARLYLPELPNHKLNTVCEYFEIPLTHHRADSDAHATAQMLLRFKNDYCKKVYNTSFEAPTEQLDMLSLALAQEELAPTRLTVKKDSLRVERVAYWEKEVKKNVWYRRIYVQVSGGRMYYDLIKKAWFNDTVKETVEFTLLERKLLAFLNVSSMEDFYQFQGKKG